MDHSAIDVGLNIAAGNTQDHCCCNKKGQRLWVGEILVYQDVILRLKQPKQQLSATTLAFCIEFVQILRTGASSDWGLTVLSLGHGGQRDSLLSQRAATGLSQSVLYRVHVVLWLKKAPTIAPVNE